MNLLSVYNKGKDLYRIKCEQGYKQLELIYIFEECFGYNKHSLILNKDKMADDKLTEKFFSMIMRRVGGEPLQYILKKWYFMGLEFKLGKGVLIPRDDTEVLVREAIKYLSCIKNPKIIDLCSGSGAIAVSLYKNLQNAEIIALEISSLAFKYLIFNIENNDCKIKAVKQNVVLDYKHYEDDYFDAIVSNPPYIPLRDIKFLQKEVRQEPIIALDGGEDGLYFYREICKNWNCKIKKGGILAVEIGVGQSEYVQNIFYCNGFKNVSCIKDINNIDRVIIGIKS